MFHLVTLARYLPPSAHLLSVSYLMGQRVSTDQLTISGIIKSGSLVLVSLFPFWLLCSASYCLFVCPCLYKPFSLYPIVNNCVLSFILLFMLFIIYCFHLYLSFNIYFHSLLFSLLFTLFCCTFFFTVL